MPTLSACTFKELEDARRNSGVYDLSTRANRKKGGKSKKKNADIDSEIDSDIDSVIESDVDSDCDAVSDRGNAKPSSRRTLSKRRSSTNSSYKDSTDSEIETMDGPTPTKKKASGRKRKTSNRGKSPVLRFSPSECISSDESSVQTTMSSLLRRPRRGRKGKRSKADH